jgi:fermentation-respiration switch protein FrsA (DUF1100 family)
MKWRSGCVRCGCVLALSYLGVCLVLWLLENTMVYRPLRAQDDWEPARLAEIQDVDLQSADGTRLHAWWLPCPGADGAVLYCHGNAGNLSHRGGSIAKFRELLKMSVLIFDYPGYGKSEGRPSEEGCYKAADAAHGFLTGKQRINPERILIYGGSLGGGVAVDLAARQPHRGLVLVKTFTSAPDAGATMFPWLPVRWLMRNRFDNAAKIKNCTRPVFIAHGTADRLIPFAQGKALFDAANPPKEFFALADADHNDPLPLEFFTALRSFLEKHP